MDALVQDAFGIALQTGFIACWFRARDGPPARGQVELFPVLDLFRTRCGARHYLHFGGINRWVSKSADRRKALIDLGFGKTAAG